MEIPSTSDDARLINVLNDRKALFMSEHAHLSPEERERRWANFILNPPQRKDDAVNVSVGKSINRQEAAQPQPIPTKKRRLDYDTTQDVVQTDALAYAGSTMSRKRSSQSQNRTSPSVHTGNRVHSARSVDNWLSATTPFNALTSGCISEATPLATRKRGPVRRIDVTTFDPEEYCKRSSQQASPNITGGFDSQRASNNLPLSPYQYTPSTLSCSPLSGSMTSPLDNQTDPTSVSMSRQTSFAGNSFCSGIQKLRLSSSMSRGASGIGPNGSSFHNNLTGPMAHEPSTLSPSFDAGQVLSYTGGAADDKKLTDAFNRNPPALNGAYDGDLSMKRENSNPSDGSSTRRSPFRSREQMASNTRTLAPKAGSSPSRTISIVAQISVPTAHSMNRAQSSESQNGQVAIPRVPYTRHIPNKVKCEECNNHADGFKGEHELKRHISRAHRPTRRVYVCIDPTPSKAFLSDCDHCNSFKRYNAYYNAAAHLRRKHFNKKPKGERRKGTLTKEEKRGGKGGGTEPKMDVLKLYMREFEIYADGTPLNDADLAYSTQASIGASNKQYNQSTTEPDDAVDIGDSMYETVDAGGATAPPSITSGEATLASVDDITYGQTNARDPVPSTPMKTFPSTYDITGGEMATLAAGPSSWPKATSLLNDFSQPSTGLIDGTRQAPLLHDHTALAIDDQSSAGVSQHFDLLFNDIPQPSDQIFQFDLEDLFSFSQS
ncbi:MAG: hypothetical protein Q9163_003085 [Psora crenata]